MRVQDGALTLAELLPPPADRAAWAGHAVPGRASDASERQGEDHDDHSTGSGVREEEDGGLAPIAEVEERSVDAMV